LDHQESFVSIMIFFSKFRKTFFYILFFFFFLHFFFFELGKTTALDKITQHLKGHGFQVFAVAEAATLL